MQEDTKHSLDQLNKFYDDGIEADKELYSEQRSNILLVSGEHYSKNKARMANVRFPTSISQKDKLRLVKNHTYKISKHYQENILMYAPNVTVLPKNETEIQDQKSAELNKAVLEHLKQKLHFKDQRRTLCKSFVDLGEVCIKAFFNQNAGDLLGYEQAVDEMGMPVFDMQGMPVPDLQKPKFKGQIDVQEIYGFNIFRPLACTDLKKPEWFGHRQVMQISDLKDIYGKDDPRCDKLEEESQDQFVIFDSMRGEYTKSKGQVIWREVYFPKCHKYPNGYYYMYTKTAIFEHGELPGGIFPIIFRELEKFPTAPRGQSVPIKTFRPYQYEINRASSSQSLHQITLGDDKILHQAGTKLAPGAKLPGVRALTFQGEPPIILPGRDGGQFSAFIQATIQEGYSAVMLEEENQEHPDRKVGDPMSLLYKSIRQKKKFASFGEGFELFLCDYAELLLKLAKFYMDDDEVIHAVGRAERINIAEFKNTTPLEYTISIEGRDETLDTILGKQMSMMNILQYVGKQLKPDDIGRFIRAMPFVNEEEAFSDFTIRSDNAKNLMLALERGEVPEINPNDDHQYMVDRLAHRKLKGDFKFLAPQIQQAYNMKIQEHQNMLVEQQRKLKAAQEDFIPVDGPLVKADVYVGDPKNPEKQPKRAQIPQRALEWLIQRLEDQGNSLDELEGMNQQALAEMAEMYLGSRGTQTPPMLNSASPRPPGEMSVPQAPMQGGV